MRAVFYGGPCDGGELVLAEPIRTVLRFPVTPEEALALFQPRRTEAHLVPSHIPATYHLELVTPDTPFRDPRNRVRYLYEVPKPARPPQPKGNPDE
jgi:hypothetical protein